MVALLDLNGKPILESTKDSNHHINFYSLLGTIHSSDTGHLGKLYSVGDSMYYPIITGVVNNNELKGYFVRWRRIVNSSKTITQLLGLMEEKKVNYYFGNTDNSLWTDLNKPVPYPLKDAVKHDDGIYEYQGKEGKAIASLTTIRNTPWVILIEFSKTELLSSVRGFLQGVIIIGSVLVLVGIFWVWRICRNITRPLNELTAAASAIASGDQSPVIELDRRDEVGKLGRAFNAMTTQVSKAKKELEEKVIETGQMNEQLRNLSAHLQNIREEERMHIAREMHDELGQFLTGLKMDIAWLNKKLAGGPEYAAHHEKLAEMNVLVDEAVVFVRKLAAELRPSILDDLGLVAALEWHSREFTRRFNIEVVLQNQTPHLETNPLVATGLFRMFQESLTNVARHADATKVVANLKAEDGYINLTVTDNGKGFDMETRGQRKTLGILGMKERALMIGGSLEIVSHPGQGTSVVISVPLEQEAAV
jgi:signal transduction histidine kinase